MAQVNNVIRVNLNKTNRIWTRFNREPYTNGLSNASSWRHNRQLLPAAHRSITTIPIRHFSSSSDDKPASEGTDEKKKEDIIPNIMALPPSFYWMNGSLYDMLVVWYTQTFRLPLVDPDFDAKEFLDGAKQAIAVVSTRLGAREFDGLESLITPKALAEIKTNVERMNDDQLREIPLTHSEIYKIDIADMSIKTTDSGQFVEILILALGEREKAAAADDKDEE